MKPTRPTQTYPMTPPIYARTATVTPFLVSIYCKFLINREELINPRKFGRGTSGGF